MVRRLHAAGFVLRTMRQREKALRDPNKRAARVDWAENASRVWSDWTDSSVWIDESYFQSSDFRKKKAWLSQEVRRENAPIDDVMRCGRLSVGVFGGICAGQLLTLYIINRGFDSSQYCDVLELLHWPVLQERFGDRPFKLLQDNAPAHKSHVVRERAEKQAPQLAQAFWLLPPYSPDLNPIEHVWARVKNKMCGNIFESREQLTEAVLRAWLEVGEERAYIQTLCSSMPRRCGAGRVGSWDRPQRRKS